MDLARQTEMVIEILNDEDSTYNILRPHMREMIKLVGSRMMHPNNRSDGAVEWMEVLMDDGVFRVVVISPPIPFDEFKADPLAWLRHLNELM